MANFYILYCILLGGVAKQQRVGVCYMLVALGSHTACVEQRVFLLDVIAMGPSVGLSLTHPPFV